MVAGRSPVGDLRDTEIKNLGDLLVLLDKVDIIRLEIPVNDPRFVGLGHGAGRVNHELGRIGGWNAPHPVETVLHALALQQLHRDVGHAVVHAVVEDLDHVHAA